jgi:hypothetical protein
MPSEMSRVFCALGISVAWVPAAVPPQALRASRTARPAAAVCILFLVFMVGPFKDFSWSDRGINRRDQSPEEMNVLEVP